jgi:hypothetical protein
VLFGWPESPKFGYSGDPNNQITEYSVTWITK